MRWLSSRSTTQLWRKRLASRAQNLRGRRKDQFFPYHRHSSSVIYRRNASSINSESLPGALSQFTRLSVNKSTRDYRVRLFNIRQCERKFVLVIKAFRPH